MPSTRFLSLLGCILAASLAQAAPSGETAPGQAPAQPSPPPPPPASAHSSPSRSLALLRDINTGFVDLYEGMAPSVVVIETKKGPARVSPESLDFFFRSPDANPHQRDLPLPDPNQLGEGSGFILRSDGVIATNNHVIDGAEKITVRLKDGRRFTAKVLGTDERTDLAVIKIDARELPPVRLVSSDQVRVGQLCFAIGVPYSLDYSFTVGVVSGKGRSRLSSVVTYEDYIQSDAFINPGNSGGPLFDIEGRVIGMNTLINGIGRGLSFAIPGEMIEEVCTQLTTNGRVRYPWLGIRIETLEENSSLREQIKGVDKGVVINTIEPDTPAYRSDLRPADVITAIDGKPVNTAEDLQKQVIRKKVGQKVILTIWRDKKSLDIPITTGELPPPGPTTVPTPPAAETPAPENGLTLEDLNKANRKRYSIPAEITKGAVITEIAPDSPASRSDLKEGDIITEVNFTPVKDAEEAGKLLAEQGKDHLLIVERDGQKTFAVLKLDN